ncbi:MAG: aminopeptidase P family protein [Anaerobutyricum soehngenii]
MKRELELLRVKMKETGVDACLIPTSDFHGSEYVGDYFKCREYISGFTGSAGTLVVTLDEAGLWTDGRYFLQAAKQLSGSGITLMRERQPGVPSIEEYLKTTLKKGETLGFDGRCIMAEYADTLITQLNALGVEVRTDIDLPGAVWEKRPPLSAQAVWPLPVEYAGESSESKIKRVREFLSEKKAQYLLLTSLEDIAWLLNMRGNDVESTPVILSYLLLGQQEIIWYVQEECLSEKIKILLEMQGIKNAPYAQIYEDVKKLPEEASVYYDKAAVNTALVSALPDKVKKIEGVNPTLLFKAKKNPVEVENERKAHIKDGVAVTKFIYWLKKNVGKQKVTERTAAAKLEEFRMAQENYIEPSFAPIIAYKEHGAIVHYSATKESDAEIQPESFVLADTGGHYLEGTTDITRTIALGTLTQEEKEMYTTVLKGHIQLEIARFLQGCSGQSLDILARTPLWEKGLDYNHGTGHGVGYLLSVHEGPNSFRYRPSVNGGNDCILEEGMITSDEPGIYLEGKFGIRLENMIVCQKDVENEYGSFLCFDSLTLVPFDLSAIILEELSTKERRWLEQYHKKVFETIAPYLTEEETEWLKETLI